MISHKFLYINKKWRCLKLKKNYEHYNVNSLIHIHIHFRYLLNALLNAFYINIFFYCQSLIRIFYSSLSKKCVFFTVLSNGNAFGFRK